MFACSVIGWVAVLPVEVGAAFLACGHVLVTFAGCELAGVGVLGSHFECLGYSLSSSA